MLTTSLNAIVIRHDKSDSKYQVNAINYPQLFYLHTRSDNKVCVATVIDKKWALTAAHCVVDRPMQDSIENGNNYSVQINGKTVEVSQLVIHPNYQKEDQAELVDLALLKFNEEVADIDPIELYRDSNEENLVVWFLGWGSTGWGTVGKKSNDGKFRRAQNRVFEASQWLHFEFDDPRIIDNQALELEGIPGLDDSGGPALLETEQGYKIVGVAIGEIEDPENPRRQGVYGAISLYERVSQHQQWIDEVISDEE